ncbi:MAG TPA: DEAD/DEAH box helicase family protein [Dysgonamonadaceae bacterium]|nr:DEAD/DEAH box helicase family protein [Dysgonamonadaceae bacterium]
MIDITYQQTGKATNTNEQGMREMQAKVYEARNSQYILVKAPPASGKSRALMFVALDKLYNLGLKKVVVAVPEKTIGRSFKNTQLKKHGFFADWRVAPYFDLCDGENERDKTGRFKEFFANSNNRILVCTHATLRFAMKEMDNSIFNDCLLAIDEFHHASASIESGLGDLLRDLMAESSVHVVAMTGSYFRGDGIPVMRPEDESRFHHITYNYYEQLNGYQYLKSLGLGYHFYQGNYLTAIEEILDTTKKTLIHIPSVNSRAATGLGKYTEVEEIMNYCGTPGEKNFDTGITEVITPDGRTLRFADLVEDSPKERTLLQSYLQRMNHKDDVDIIIALGTAKEGFDWEWCEHCLTVGVRGSLTEVVQIIGRCTRDCDGKEHAQFTNLIAAPDSAQDDVTRSVNDMLKAIVASLLMEQVMAPSWNFKTRKEYEESGEELGEREIIVEGLKPLSSVKSTQIVSEQLDDLKATILQNDMIVRALDGNTPPEVINSVLIPKIIKEKHPDLSDEEVEEVRQRVVLDTIVKGNDMTESAGNRFLKLANRFINIDTLSINMINSINPFQRAYEIMSKSVTAPVLKLIQDTIAEQKYNMTVEEAIILFKGPLKEYIEKHDGKMPTITDPSPQVQRLAQAFTIIANEKRRYMSGLTKQE